MPTPIRSAVLRALLAASLLALGGCMLLRTKPPPPAEPEPVAAEPAPEIAVVPPEPAPPKPKPAPPKPKPTPPPRNVVVLFQDGALGYSDVAAQIVEQLPVARYHAVLLPIRAPDSPEI